MAPELSTLPVIPGREAVIDSKEEIGVKNVTPDLAKNDTFFRGCSPE